VVGGLSVMFGAVWAIVVVPVSAPTFRARGFLHSSRAGRAWNMQLAGARCSTKTRILFAQR
jgi:hypothetical protein